MTPRLRYSSPLLLLTISFLVAFAAVSNAGQVAVYWGQNSGEGSLVETCASGLINIAFLNKFGNGQDPDTNLVGHCEHAAGTCAALSSEISSCKDSGVKVLLSLSCAAGSYSLASTDYLCNNFLGGSSAKQSLGKCSGWRDAASAPGYDCRNAGS